MAEKGSYKSVVPSVPQGRVFQRGGKRTRHVATTEALDQGALRSILAACHTAIEIGLPLNRMITIHWERAGIQPGPECAKATAAYLKSVGDLLRRRGGRTAYVWIRENDYGDGSKGDHVHILLHLPAGISIGHVQRGWIRRITGKPYRRGVVYTGRIGGTAGASEHHPEHYRANLATVAEYVLKGGRQRDADALGLSRWGDGGQVIGRRIGISKNLVR